MPKSKKSDCPNRKRIPFCLRAKRLRLDVPDAAGAPQGDRPGVGVNPALSIEYGEFVGEIPGAGVQQRCHEFALS